MSTLLQVETGWKVLTRNTMISRSSSNLSFPLLKVHEVFWWSRVDWELRKGHNKRVLTSFPFNSSLHCWPGFESDKGIQLIEAMKHYAFSSKFSEPLQTKGKDVVVQYEIKLEEGLTCGGKIFYSLSAQWEGPDSETRIVFTTSTNYPYIMKILDCLLQVHTSRCQWQQMI